MKTSDIQQLASGFNTVAVFGGPMVVRVHEALDVAYTGQKSRYFISVDLKFRESDALNIGKLGWLGCTKAEATREANTLAHKIYSAHSALEAAEEQAAKWDTSSNRHTVKIQAESLNRIAGRYVSELEPA